MNPAVGILVKTSVHNCSNIKIIIRCQVDGDEEEKEEDVVVSVSSILLAASPIHSEL